MPNGKIEITEQIKQEMHKAPSNSVKYMENIE